MTMTQPDFTKAPNPEEAHAVAATLGKRGKELDENAQVAAEAKAMSASYVPRPRAVAIPAVMPAHLVGSGDLSLPEELRRFNPGPGIKPMSEADYREKFDQGAQFTSWEVQERERQQAILDSEKSDYQWYIRCKECLDHGIYLTRPIQRGEVLGMMDWYARYKPKAEDFWDRMPVCQACLHKGQEVPLPIGMVDQWKRTWKPNPRWVWKVAKDQERFRFEGNFRALLLEWGASNSHIEDIERRRKLYKEWKAQQEAKKEKEVASRG
jgi:hypothetical protein